MSTPRNQEPRFLPWADRPFGELVRLAGPLVLSCLSYGAMSAVDTFFVARLGTDALAGASLGVLAVFLLIVFPFGVLRAVKIRASHAVGAGEFGRLPYELGAGLCMAGGLAVVTLVSGLGMLGWVPSFAPNALSADAAEAYFGVWLLGVPGALFKAAVREFRYGVGDTRLPMAAALLGNGINFLLDPLLMFAFDFGVVGAAWATVAAHHVELAVLVWAQVRTRVGPEYPSSAEVCGLWRLGFPTGVQYFMEIGSFVLLGVIVASFGRLELAAHQIAFQLSHFVFLPAMALGEAASILVGQAVGARRRELVWGVARGAIAVAIVYGFVWALVLSLFPTAIGRLFSVDDGLLAVLVPLLRLAGLFVVFDAVQVVVRCVLRGTGDVRVPAVLGIVFAWVLTPPAGYFLGHVLDWGAVGGWVGLLGELVLLTISLVWRLVAQWRPVSARSIPLAERSPGRQPARFVGRDATRESRPHCDDPRAPLPSAADSARPPGPVHVARGGDAERADHRQEGQRGDAGPVSARRLTGQDGDAFGPSHPGRDPYARSRPDQGEEREGHRRTSRDEARRESSRGSRRPRRTPGGWA